MEPSKTRAVAIVSGGLDSTTMLYHSTKDPNAQVEIVKAVSFNYGQRHKKELDFAQQSAELLHIPWTLIDLWSSGLTEALSVSGSSLVSKTAVPEGHYAADNMKATVVPNRNMIMLALAGGIAVAENAPLIMTAVHAGDHFIYPDCRSEFIRMFSNAFKSGNMGFGPFEYADDFANTVGGAYAPYIYESKGQIAYHALQYNMPFHSTWSCYKGEEIHCGKCRTCVERLEAIDWAVKKMYGPTADPADYDFTKYEDSNFWKEAIAGA